MIQSALNLLNVNIGSSPQAGGYCLKDIRDPKAPPFVPIQYFKELRLNPPYIDSY